MPTDLCVLCIIGGCHHNYRQLTPHHFATAGRIIARYEAPVVTFLFPQERHGSSETAPPPVVMQAVIMNKSRKYEVSHVLHAR